MENNLIQNGQIRPNYAKAVKLHSQIMTNGAIAVQALANMCAELKQMRDEQLYAELGYDTFDDYAEKAVGIKKRQAYNYISTYERLGSTILQSNAQLGITKLALLADVPDTERADFSENNDLESMSTREMKELVEKLKKQVTDQGEQLSLLTAAQDKDASVQDHDDTGNEALAEAERQLEEAQNRIAELEKAEPDAKVLEKARKDAEKEAKKGIKDKLKAEAEKARTAAIKEMDERLETVKKEARAAGAEEAKKGLADIEQEKAAAIARAQELEKKLAIASNKETVLFAHLFEEMQGNFNRAIGCVEKIAQGDTETAGKLRGALKKCLEMMEGKVNEKTDNQHG
ncbi:MAG: DUF3102 domain-containing protein [Ethanoligenens sp.]